MIAMERLYEVTADRSVSVPITLSDLERRDVIEGSFFPGGSP